ncbi:hypothetical protein VCRA2113O199_130025 [Vibrio crassostreae]|nr:hypothetical protein VCHA53O468_140024 [Vibrio chagasii]CAK1744869.1 hypothetical protein VCRA2114O367_130025 [Vibrio crassostreae]CAH7002479.1 hypothetical protein VCHA55O507_130123 [Vibrio chagasii]CAH7392471.1 hypothetical protein VCHA43P273_60230 [Vibrio chagasii]CAK1745565.1 hypothetical protein VCRA2113O354_130025 [Vibrio crassostreae]
MWQDSKSKTIKTGGNSLYSPSRGSGAEGFNKGDPDWQERPQNSVKKKRK